MFFFKDSIIKCSVGILICMVTGHAIAQNKVEQALETLSQKYPQEKVYLLYDKDYYLAGENIWFNAFVFEGYGRSLISTNLTLELYNSKKTLINRKNIPLFEGEGQGSFSLADSLPEGIYYIRGFTQWMLNFDEAFQYVHSFRVYNPASPQKLAPDTAAVWKAAAYPEGGSLIAGLNSKVAVRLFSNGALPDSWSGYVVDATKPSEKITSFNGLDRNVGIFSFTPAENKKYQVIVEDKKGRKQTVALSPAAASGVSLQVNNTDEAIDYTLRFKNLPDDAKGYKVIGTINNILVYKANINKINPEISSSIPADKLINGILHLTVFNGEEKVVAERLCFVQLGKLHVGRPAFPPLYLTGKPRSVNGFDMLPDTNYLKYSVLVLDGNVKEEPFGDNILTSLWLTSDFPGRIDAPARYFDIGTELEDMDALLISEKWTRFNWEQIISGKFPEIHYIPEPYISYKGTVYGGGGVVANQNVNLIFYFADSTTQLNQVTTDSKGSFELKNLIFEEPLKVYYQVNDKKIAPRDASITFESLNKVVPYKGDLPPAGYLMVKRPPNDKPSEDLARGLNNLNNQKDADARFKTLEEVKIVAQKKSNKEQLNEKLSSGMFRSMNEDVFDLVNENQDAASYPNILQWLQGRVAGLQIQMQGGDYIPIIRGSRVQLYLDEMAVDPGSISSLPVSDIAMVKVIKSGFVGGIGGGGGGAVAIYTRRGDTQAANAQKPPSLNNSILIGYDKIAPFYQPDYKDASVKRLEKDTRDVLYWNPALMPDGTKPIQVRFFNNDDVKSIRVVIIGFSKDDDTPLYYNEIFRL
ncbi:MAG: hypothetical protein M9933_07285 [Chitinophagaceae bacterium]|nr:hypothetical protein [Chitinophagaceae bacterium]